MSKKTGYLSIDLELLLDIKPFANVLKSEPDFSEEVATILAFLAKRELRATFFITYNFVLLHEAMVKQIIEAGHDVGLHYVNHRHEEVSIEQFRAEVSYAKDYYEKRFNTPLLGYRAPAFDLTMEQYDVLTDLGFVYDSSYFVYKNAFRHSQFEPNGILKEFPVWEKQTFPLAGGAYLRLLPAFLMRWLLKVYIKNNLYYNFYIHPYDYSPQKIYRRDASMRMKLFFGRGRKKYLKRLDWIIKTLQRYGYTIKLYREDL